VLVVARRTGLGQVRAYLAADLLRRLSERARLAPTVIDLLPDGQDELRAVCAELNIHPPLRTLTPPPAIDQLAGQFADGFREPVFDVGVRVAGEPPELCSPVGTDQPGSPVGTDQPTVEELARHWIEVAGAGGATVGVAVGTESELLALGEEPLSVRLKLLRHGYGEPLGDGGDLDAGEAGAAAKELARWRELVARWARSPSGAMSRRYADAITGAFEDDLDTTAALRELAALADDPGEPDGVKFETFAAADRLFGLDLAREIGR
jgi:hypothetical protein